MAELGEGPAPGAAPAGKPFNRPIMGQNIGGHQFALEAPPSQQFNKPPSLVSCSNLPVSLLEMLGNQKQKNLDHVIFLLIIC